MKKRILCLVLCLAMILPVFAGCGSSKTPAASTPDTAADPANDPLLNNEETINLTVFSQLANWSGAQSGWGATLLKDLFNITLTIIPDTNGAYQTRMESGNLGDIIAWGSNDDQYAAAVDKGLLFDWEEEDLLHTYGSYIEETFPDALAANRSINSDGQIYGIGHSVTNQANAHDTFFYDWGIRWDLYKELGYPEVKNLDDLADVLGQMKAICPTGDDGKPTYGVSLWPDWDGDMVMYVKAMASAYYGYDELGIGLYDASNGDFHDALEADGPYMEALKFLNKLYRNNLLDPDSMTQTFDQLMPKVTNGNVLFSIFDFSGSILFNTATHVAENKYMEPLVPEEASVIVYGLSTGGGDRIWSIGNNTLYPEKCMQLINWLYTPEGAMTIWYGIRGLMWDIDKNGGIYFTDLGETCYFDPSTDLTGVEWTSPYTGETYTLDGTFNDGKIQINNTSWAFGAENPESDGECFQYTSWASQMGDPKNDTDADWREHTDSIGTQDYLNKVSYSIVPVVSEYAKPERDAELELKWNQVITAIKNGSWNAIYAKDDAEFESIVSKMRADCDAYGYDACVEWCRNEAARKFAMQ